MRTEHNMPQYDVQSWVAGFVVGIPVLGGLWAARVATHNRIDKANAGIVEAKEDCEKIRLEIKECQLSNAKNFASVAHLNEVKSDIKDEMKAIEKRLIHAIRGT